MKSILFSFESTYIESVEAFCNTVDVIDVKWYDNYLVIMYN